LVGVIGPASFEAIAARRAEPRAREGDPGQGRVKEVEGWVEKAERVSEKKTVKEV
jgi:hypothetical protein